jgi:hypothetical protein
MSSPALAVPAASAVPSVEDEALLALVLDATQPIDAAAAVRALVRLAEVGETRALRLLLALAHEAAVAAWRREALPAEQAEVIAGHVLAALKRELQGGNQEHADGAIQWLLALATDGAQARVAP